MICRARTRRPGVTLLEVLTAIFIMGIGLLAILTLFPLGALSMARAVRDDRAATIAANAASVAAALDLRNDRFVTDGFNIAPPAATDLSGPGNLVIVDPAYVVLNNDPYMKVNSNPATGPVLNPPAPAAGKFAGQDGVIRVASSVVRNMTPADPGPGPPPASYPQNILGKSVVRWFTFQDEIEFERVGLPKGFSSMGTATVSRPGTYTWAYMIRRPRYNWPELAELTVIVYASRSIDTQEGEKPFAVTPVDVSYTTPLGTSTIELDHGGSKPNIRRGAWLLDTTLNTGKNIVNGDFYKVETVADKDANTYTLQLDRPIKYPYPLSPPAPAPPFTAPNKAVPSKMVWMENVIAVVERGTTWNP